MSRPAPAAARVRPPGSKSITNRALLVAALADGTSVLEGALDGDDTQTMVAALRALGVDVVEEAGRLEVRGCGGRLRPGPLELDVRDAGTVARFLPPALALGEGEYRLDGSARMRERPVAPLVAALRELGLEVAGDAFPLRIAGARGRVRSEVEVAASLSSQYVSGLLLAAPYYEHGLRLAPAGPIVSRPYVRMTLAVMRAFGVEVAEREPYAVLPGRYRRRRYAIEPDATAASYFFAAAAITGGRVVVEGLGAGSLQGDVGFVHVLEQMGCRVVLGEHETEVEGPERLRGVDVDLRDMSDTAQTLAAVAVFADGPTRIRGIGFIRGKESDRVGGVVRELRRAGVDAEEEADGLVVRPGRPRPARIETYGDHRMAMSFALLGLRVPGIEIADPGCVSKTYPGYFADLARVREAFGLDAWGTLVP